MHVARTCLLGGALLLAASCAPVDVWHKEGVSPSFLARDLTACELDAARSVPVNTQVGTTPIYRTPVNTNCYTLGNSVQCTQSGGQVYGGDVYTYDANAGLRERVTTQCMEAKGYTVASLPRCSAAQIEAAPAYTGFQPRLTAGSCVTQPSGDGWVILNPA